MEIISSKKNKNDNETDSPFQLQGWQFKDYKRASRIVGSSPSSCNIDAVISWMAKVLWWTGDALHPPFFIFLIYLMYIAPVTVPLSR